MLSWVACWQAALQEVSALFAEELQDARKILAAWLHSVDPCTTPLAVWLALVQGLDQALSKPGSSAAVNDARQKLACIMKWQVRLSAGYHGLVCVCVCVCLCLLVFEAFPAGHTHDWPLP